MDKESGGDRDPVEQLAEQFLGELREGRQTSVEDYQRRYPDHSDAIKALFPTLLMMEDLKPATHRPRDSSDTLLDRNVKQLGDFRIVRKIAHGGMGIVYEAQQQSLDRPVAMKVFAPTLFTSTRLIRRFKLEAKAAGALHHSNIVPVLGVGEQWGIHYYIMQLIDGKSLDQVMATSKNRMPAESVFRIRGDWHRIADIGRQLTSALSYAHSRNVLHRDIKPANLILDREGTAWVTDFGLAKLTEHEDGATRTGQALGTLRYMPPEQFEGKVDERSDIYSLGLTLYELLTWRRAFTESDHGKLIHQMASVVPPQPRAVDRKIPRDLETIVLKAMSRNPDHRYATAGEMEEDLARFLDDEPIKARRVPVTEKLARWARRNRALAAASLSAAALAMVVLFLSLWGYSRVQTALEGETLERERATANSTLAMGALNSIFDGFGIERISDVGRTSEPMLSPAAATLLENLVHYYEALAERDADAPGVLLKAAEAQLTIGNIRQRLGEYESAIGAYESAIEKFQRLEPSTIHEITIASIHNNMGWVYETHGKQALGVAEHGKAKSILEKWLSKNSASADASLDRARYELARTLFLTGRRIRPGMGPQSVPPQIAIDDLVPNSRETNGDNDVIEPEVPVLDQAIELLEELASRENSPPVFRQLLARCLRERASDDLSTRSESDNEMESRGLEILADLAGDYPEDTDCQLDLVESLAELLVFGTSINPDVAPQAESRLLRAVEQGEDLVGKRPDMALYALVVSHAHFKLAAVLEYQAKLSSREEHHQKSLEAEEQILLAIDLLDDLRTRFPDAVGFDVWQAFFEARCGDIQISLRHHDDAHHAFARAIRLLESLGDAPEVAGDLLEICYDRLDQSYIEVDTPKELLPSALRD